MQRVGFKMKLYEGQVEEYKKRHDEIWPDLVDELHKAGLQEFSIFLDEDSRTLFAFHLLREDVISKGQPGGEVQRKWWEYMSPLMECNDDNSPKTWPLKEVFYMK
jgi:L-rhamnose mutarotase